MKNRLYLNLIICTVLFSLCACSSTVQVVEKPQSIHVPPNKVRIIVDRVDALIGCGVAFKIYDVYDGYKYIGELGNGGQLVWDRNLTKLKIKAVRPYILYNSKEYNVKAGETYRFKTKPFSQHEFKLFDFIPNTQQTPQKETEKKTLHKQVDSFIVSKDLKSLKKYTDENPNAVYYIKDKSIRLALTGPKGLKVGDIRKYVKEGKNERILVSLIKSAKTPYKEFTMEEIEILLEMGLSDKIVSAMIDVTTLLYRDAKLKEEQLFLINEQRKISEQNQINYSNSNNSVDKQGNPIIKKVQNEAIKQGVGLLLDNLF